MPSLLGTTVATNYGRMVPQQGYGVGSLFSNFGTRQLRVLKVIATGNDGSTAVLFQKDTGLTGGAAYSTVGTGYQASNSAFSKAVRALQVGAEIYQVYTPGTTGFLVLVTEDTVNDSDTTGNTADGSYGDLEAAVVASLGFGGSSTCTITTVTTDSTGVAFA